MHLLLTLGLNSADVVMESSVHFLDQLEKSKQQSERNSLNELNIVDAIIR